MKKPKQKSISKAKIAILGVAIAIILALFIGYGIYTFYKEPTYEDYCGDTTKPVSIETQEACEAQGGMWTGFESAKAVSDLESDQLLCTKTMENDEQVTLSCTSKEMQQQSGYCDVDYYCRKQLEDDREIYNRNVFFITVIAGIIFLIIGGVFIEVSSVGSGLMGGAIISMIYGTLRYWGDMSDWLRFILLGVVLAILIWMGYKKLSK